jgi:hypothetical protein
MGGSGRPHLTPTWRNRTSLGTILASALSIPQLATTAWAAAASFRGTDMRDGANGARVHRVPAARGLGDCLVQVAYQRSGTARPGAKESG